MKYLIINNYDYLDLFAIYHDGVVETKENCDMGLFAKLYNSLYRDHEYEFKRKVLERYAKDYDLIIMCSLTGEAEILREPK